MIRLSERTRRVRVLLAVLLTASLALVTIDFRSRGGEGPLDKIGRAAAAVLGPLQDGLGKIFRPVGNFFAGFTQVGDLKARIRALEEQNSTLTLREERVAEISRENDRLRALLAIGGQLSLVTTTAQVIGVGPSNFEHSIVIDRGTADGVRKDMPVLGGEGLVGRVLQAAAHTAQVLLIVDPSSAVAGRLAGNGEVGVLEGSGRQELRFRLFDSTASVSVGDGVVTSGFRESVYPPGIPIGKVSRLEPPSGALTRTVYVKPYVDFTSLDFVLVVKGGKP
jgi:rod shape-determining protein MreC